MSLIQEIKIAQLKFRKQRNIIAASILTTLISEASVIGKNDGNRESTDIEVIAIIKKFIKNIDEVIRVAGDYRDADRVDSAWEEKTLLEQFLPKQFVGDELSLIIDQFIVETNATSVKDMGKVMKVLKEKFEGQFDGTAASKLVKEKLGMI